MDTERREYFRINDKMIFHYEKISDADIKTKIQAVQAGVHPDESTRKHVLGLETQLKGLLDQLRSDSPKTTNVLGLINAKIDLMADTLGEIDPRMKNLVNKTVHQVNISAGGIGFVTNELLEIDSYLTIEMILCPSFHYILTCGRVISVKREQENYRIGVNFEALSEDDQEILIQHILKKQNEQLVSERVKRENNQ